MNSTPDEHWGDIKRALLSIANGVVSHITKERNKIWFTAGTWRGIQEHRELKVSGG